LKFKILVAIFAATLMISVLFSSLQLVHADYTVAYASFPPLLAGDINNDGKVDLKDLAILAKAYGSVFGGANWNPCADVNNDGKVDLRDQAIVAKAYGAVYSTSATPIAYSTSFEFDVPNDGDNTVWYYMLVQFYAPQTAVYNLVEDSVDDWVLNVKIDNQLMYGGSTSDPACVCHTVSLGSLSQGYHLLELNYVEKWGAGILKFHVATANGVYAQLNRFRIYVPNYSSSNIGYSVTTNTYFADADYFLGGFADKSIDNVHTTWSQGPNWPGWMWNTGSVAGSLGAIYGWGDGFMYPLGTPGVGSHSLGFKFENYGAGLLDFEYTSRAYEPAKIGQPKFYASATTSNLGWGMTVNNAKIYGSSQWLGNPGVSERNVNLLTTYNVSFSDGSGDYFYAPLDIALGNWWAQWELTAGAPPDMAIPLNFTVESITSDFSRLLQAYPQWSGWDVDMALKNYKIDTYSFQGLQIQGLEVNTGQSAGRVVQSPPIIALNLAGSALMTASAFMGPLAPIGAVVGFGATVLAAVFDYLQGQPVSRYTQTVQQNNHWQLTANNPMYFQDCYDGMASKSQSDMAFLKFQPISGYTCGLTEVVLTGTLDSVLNIVIPPGSITFNPTHFDFPIGNIQIILCTPWFVWSQS
jgi:hypothetical protein